MESDLYFELDFMEGEAFMKENINKKVFLNMQGEKDLVEFLNDHGLNHKNYHHYTDIDSAIKILNSGSLHLTRGNSMSINDYQECKKGSEEDWYKTYIASFGYGNNENMAMWGLYGLPWQNAVRISIPGSLMIKWINSINNIYSTSYENGTYMYNKLACKKNINLADIIYIAGDRSSQNLKLTWKDISMNVSENPQLLHIDEKAEMTGYIKNSAWKYENEVRIRVYTQEKINYEKISIQIPPEITEGITITAGPYFKGNIADIIEQKVTTPPRNILNSIFTNLVNYKSICKMCNYEFTNKIH